VNRKDKSLNKLSNNKIFCGIKSCNTCSNAVFQHWHSPTIVCYSFRLTPSMIRCLKSAQKSAV